MKENVMSSGEKKGFGILVRKTKESGKWTDGKSIRMNHKELG
jgi:hypothetical protein